MSEGHETAAPGPLLTSPTCSYLGLFRIMIHCQLMFFSYSCPVCAPDADITFQSSDRVLFHAHRKNLETNSAAFPPAEMLVCDEFVPLSEDSTTLELLFSFMYPRRHPDLESTPCEILAPLAEAAEKYEVFAAMNICKIRMR